MSTAAVAACAEGLLTAERRPGIERLQAVLEAFHRLLLDLELPERAAWDGALPEARAELARLLRQLATALRFVAAAGGMEGPPARELEAALRERADLLSRRDARLAEVESVRGEIGVLREELYVLERLARLRALRAEVGGRLAELRGRAGALRRLGEAADRSGERLRALTGEIESRLLEAETLMRLEIEADELAAQQAEKQVTEAGA